MNPVMYIIMNPALKMSEGKGRAQSAHAATQALRRSINGGTPRPLLDAWFSGGHYAKVVLGTDDLLVADRYLRDRGFDPQLIIDEGRTEFADDLTPTAIGMAVVDKDDPHVSETFGTFRLYRAEPPEPIVTDKATEGVVELNDHTVERPGFAHSVNQALAMEGVKLNHMNPRSFHGITARLRRGASRGA